MQKHFPGKKTEEYRRMLGSFGVTGDLALQQVSVSSFSSFTLVHFSAKMFFGKRQVAQKSRSFLPILCLHHNFLFFFPRLPAFPEDKNPEWLLPFCVHIGPIFLSSTSPPIILTLRPLRPLATPSLITKSVLPFFSFLDLWNFSLFHSLGSFTLLRVQEGKEVEN